METELFDPARSCAGFDCGNDELSRWLTANAPHARRQGTALLVAWDGDRPTGYYALCPHTIDRAQVSSKFRAGPQQIPAMLIAKLAVATDWQGRGLGNELLIEAIRRSVAAMTAAGGALIVVDAIDDRAVRFYEDRGFQRAKVDRRLVMLYKDAVATLGPPR